MHLDAMINKGGDKNARMATLDFEKITVRSDGRAFIHSCGGGNSDSGAKGKL